MHKSIIEIEEFNFSLKGVKINGKNIENLNKLFDEFFNTLKSDTTSNVEKVLTSINSDLYELITEVKGITSNLKTGKDKEPGFEILKPSYSIWIEYGKKIYDNTLVLVDFKDSKELISTAKTVYLLLREQNNRHSQLRVYPVLEHLISDLEQIVKVLENLKRQVLTLKTELC